MCLTGTLPSCLSPSSSFSEISAENRQERGEGVGWGRGDDEQKGMVGSRGTKLRRPSSGSDRNVLGELGHVISSVTSLSSSVTWAQSSCDD